MLTCTSTHPINEAHTQRLKPMPATALARCTAASICGRGGDAVAMAAPALRHRQRQPGGSCAAGGSAGVRLWLHPRGSRRGLQAAHRMHALSPGSSGRRGIPPTFQSAWCTHLHSRTVPKSHEVSVDACFSDARSQSESGSWVYRVFRCAVVAAGFAHTHIRAAQLHGSTSCRLHLS